MEFQLGDFVVHPAHGIGQIVAIQELEFVENSQSLFYQVGYENMTVWVQVQNGDVLRAITLKAALSHYQDVLESPPVSLNRDFHARHKELEARLQDHSFQILCEVVRDLNALSKGKVLNNYERNLFRRTSSSLQQEWAFSSGSSLDETSHLIEDMLQKGVNKSSSLNPSNR